VIAEFRVGASGVVFGVPNGDPDPRRALQFYALAGLEALPFFQTATSDLERVRALGSRISSLTIDRFDADDLARICAAYREFVRLATPKEALPCST